MSLDQIQEQRMTSSFLSALAAVAASAALVLPGAAQAAKISSGVVTEGYGGDWLNLGESGVYTFASEAEIINYYDISAILMERFDAHSDDHQQWWGSNRFQESSWYDFSTPPALFQLTPNGFSWTVHLPEASAKHFDDCYFGEPVACGYTEYRDYAVELRMLVIFGADSEGAAWSIDHAPLPAVVPEPSTWAMLIIGFSAVGSVVRRRRHITALADQHPSEFPPSTSG